MPELVGHFYATAGFFYTANVLGLIGWTENKVLTPREILDATTQLCPLTQAEALTHFPHSKWKYLQKACFAGHYVFSVLSEYGFEESDNSITFAREIHGSVVGWARGAVLFET